MCGASTFKAAAFIPRRQVTLVALGDSLTFGFPYLPDQSWVAAIARLMPGVVNKGRCGDTTADMLLRFDRDVAHLRPQFVIICGGANDFLQEAPLREVADNIAVMLQRAAAGGMLPLAALPAPCNWQQVEKRLAPLRYWLREHVPPARLIDFYTPLRHPVADGYAPGLTTDGVHPSLPGYAAMAQAAWQVLQPLWQATEAKSRR